MRSKINLMKVLVLSVFALGLVLAAVPTTKAAAASLPAGRCSATAPATWSWSTTRVYNRNMLWCLHLKSQASYLIWQQDGNFVWYVGNGKGGFDIVAKSDTQQGSGSRGSGNSLTVQTDGNLVIKDASGKALWGLNYLMSGPARWQSARASGDTFTLDLSVYFYTGGHTPCIDYYDYHGSTHEYSATIATQ